MNKYCGNAKPYIYALFGDSDRGHAETVMEALSQKGYSLWYGSAFNKKEEMRLSRAAALLVVISRDFAESNVLKKAVGQAAKANIPIVAVYREWVKLSPGLSMQLGSNLGVVRENFASEEAYLEKLCASPVLAGLAVTPAQKKAAKQSALRFGLGAVASVVLVAAVVLMRLLTVEVTIDPDSELGRLGLSGNALDVKELYVYGDTTRESYGLSYPRTMYTRDEHGRYVSEWLQLSDGDRRVRGSVADVSSFVQLENLTELCLAGNQVSDISPLASLTELKMLDLSVNNLYEADLRVLTQLPELEVLNLAYSMPQNLSVLRGCPSLKTLYVTAEAYWGEATSLPGVDVIYLDNGVRNYAQLKDVCNNDGITDICIAGNITIPAGETLTIPANVRVYCVHGGNYSFINNGTLEVQGNFRPAFMTMLNYGTILVQEWGVFDAGRSYVENYGGLVIEEGGCMALQEAGEVYLQQGNFRNDGYVLGRDLAQLHFNGGSFENNDSMEFQLLGECYDGDAEFRGDVSKITGKGSFRIGDEYLLGE